MDLDEGVLEDGSEDVTAGDVVADLGSRGEVPLLGAVERGNRDTTRDVDALGRFRDLLERALDTVVDVVQQAGAELDREGLAGPVDRVADGDTGCG